MNERIQELFKRAGGKTSSRNLASNPVQVVETHELWDDRIEKFAELIVRECIQSIENTIQTNCETDGEKMGCEFAITDLKKHFGVEE